MPIRASAYTPPWRIVAGILVGVSRSSVLAIAVGLVFFETRLDNPLHLLRTFAVASAVPAIAAWALARAFAAVVTIADGVLVVRRRDLRVEVPVASIANVIPWRVPLPGPGVWLELASGRRLPFGIQLRNPSALMLALADAGAAPAVLTHAEQSATAYAATDTDDTRRWWHPWLKFVGLALVPTLPVFRLNQWIVYGGTFGEYYTYGLRAYLFGFAAHWWTFTIYLVLWAGVLRTVVEATVLAAAYAAPLRVAGVRRTAERLYWIAYVGGVPLFLLRVALLAS